MWIMYRKSKRSWGHHRMWPLLWKACRNHSGRFYDNRAPLLNLSFFTKSLSPLAWWSQKRLKSRVSALTMTGELASTQETRVRTHELGWQWASRKGYQYWPRDADGAKGNLSQYLAGRRAHLSHGASSHMPVSELWTPVCRMQKGWDAGGCDLRNQGAARKSALQGLFWGSRTRNESPAQPTTASLWTPRTRAWPCTASAEFFKELQVTPCSGQQRFPLSSTMYTLNRKRGGGQRPGVELQDTGTRYLCTNTLFLQTSYIKGQHSAVWQIKAALSRSEDAHEDIWSTRQCAERLESGSRVGATRADWWAHEEMGIKYQDQRLRTASSPWSVF